MVTKIFRLSLYSIIFYTSIPSRKMSSKTEANKQYYQANKPYPIRLGDLKPKIQKEAFETDKSMHDVLRNIVEQHYQEDQIANPYAIKEMAKKAKEKLEAELNRIKCYGTKFIDRHEKLLSYSGSEFLLSSYKEIPELKPDIDLAVNAIKEKFEVRINKLREEVLARDGIEMITFSEKELQALNTDIINYSVQSVRKKVEKKVEELKKELVEI